MEPPIPLDRWQPLSAEAAVALFRDAPFAWALAGGYAIEQFLGAAIRPHADVDIAVFRDDQLSAQRWLDGWRIYAADPPGALRPWAADEYLPPAIHDLWAFREGTQAWELQLMLAETDGAAWYHRRAPAIREPRGALFVRYGGVPCVRVEVQLLYKARGNRPKDNADFTACLPRLSADARAWLARNLAILSPDGHPWLDRLEQYDELPGL